MAKPQDGILKEPVLEIRIENLFPVTHVDVKHSILGVGPHHWDVTFR
jgi:hypothetical protein